MFTVPGIIMYKIHLVENILKIFFSEKGILQLTNTLPNCYEKNAKEK
jgi:hypothetical protein